VGALDASGALRINIQPGEHEIEFRKENHEPLRLKRSVTAGETLPISGAQAQLRPFGSLQFEISPRAARVRYRRDGDSQFLSAQPGDTIRAREGVYIVEASADKHVTRNERVQVAAGKPVSLRWALEAVKVDAPPPPAVRLTKDYFTNGDQWKPEDDGWYSIDSKNYSWFKSAKGTIHVDIQKGKRGFFGRRKTEWVVAYHDERNYVSYEIGGGELKRKSVMDGRRQEESFPHSMGGDEYFSLSITIEPKRIVHRDNNGAEIDVFPSRPEDDFTRGRFGFKGEATVRIRD
jgi:hypothetical protein